MRALAAPDLPARRSPSNAAGAHAELDALDLTWRGGVDIAHAHLTECVVLPTVLEGVLGRGATLIDVAFDDVVCPSVDLRDASLRRVRFRGGRIGALDLQGARVADVILDDVRVDYLTFAGARLENVVLSESRIRSLDLPLATIEGAQIAGTEIGELDPREMRAKSFDLRGAEIGRILNVASLRGATLSPAQADAMTLAFADALGIHVES
ncbi:pentapeptide repeat-containing protein [Microbacterium sp. G2-8]|uniref:pentapeptide repeat-containing protein n=1 Tax=Microbacterium sp. G2-8 TaxID=2842454 RepID=UPI001C89F8E7|nr:pentapeptide repeat-containing protein [Microbacterium sp. G2-8]